MISLSTTVHINMRFYQNYNASVLLITQYIALFELVSAALHIRSSTTLRISWSQSRLSESGICGSKSQMVGISKSGM
jgi:hypothetical protein